MIALSQSVIFQLGAMGITVMVSSGDAGSTNVGHGSDACSPIQPQYPASSPYVTSGTSALCLRLNALIMTTSERHIHDFKVGAGVLSRSERTAWYLRTNQHWRSSSCSE